MIRSSKEALAFVLVSSTLNHKGVNAGADCELECGTDFLGNTQYWVTKDDDAICDLDFDELFCTSNPLLYTWKGYECADDDDCVPDPPPHGGMTRFLPSNNGEHSLDLQPDDHTLRRLVQETEHGALNSAFDEQGRFLSQEQCDVIIQDMEEALKEAKVNGPGKQQAGRFLFESPGHELDEDMVYALSARRLKSLLGGDTKTVAKLYHTFKDFNDGKSPDRIYARRTSLGDMAHHIDYHAEKAGEAAMIVHLNGDDLGKDNGSITYLTPDGPVATASGTGDAIVHKDGVVHAVSPFIGTRYTLLLYSDGVSTNDPLRRAIPVDHH